MKRVIIVSFSISIAILFLATGGYVLWQTRTAQNKRPSAPVTVAPAPSPAASASAVFSFFPSENTRRVGETFIIDILLDMGEETTTNGDIVLSFDPAIIAPVDITPGEFFAQPQEFKKTVDIKKAIIFYALGSFTPSRGKGVVARVQFSARARGQTALLLSAQTTIAGARGRSIPVQLPQALPIVIQ